MIQIVEYTERWAKEFRVIGQQLRQALGSLALRIDHVGSTSVPGLAAKDIIDVQVTVRTLEPFDMIQERFESIGYILRPQGRATTNRLTSAARSRNGTSATSENQQVSDLFMCMCERRDAPISAMRSCFVTTSVRIRQPPQRMPR